ncbi:Ig-like domain-containing protein (plasmid) [Paenibacillus rhizovicinus]|uniref:Ig-like domain-containing protein n=1 Tax=Paenibacillus rhizovicinus TaxID=2704463 RepID=A0A6C0PB52_9BACL|nr:Ig-like domain-containing protein [Paenibacillus rhizovicinus]QHW35666.1 Ig-like domain-containing protein [Paenibacillus rhizovicinus]
MIPLDEEYIPPKEFGMKTGIGVPTIDPDNPRRVILKITEPLKLNHSYTLVLDKGIKSVSGNLLEETMAIAFTTEYGPLYAGPLEVRSVVKKLYTSFELSEIYVALRNAGQKAHQLQGLIVDVNNSRYKALEERDNAYFPTQKYVAYEAARALLSSLLMRILNSDASTGGPTSTASTSGMVTLGDLTVQESASSGSGTGGGSGNSDPLTMVEDALSDLSGELKFWQDAMLGRNRRGYAAPVSANFRTAAGSPESRAFE